MVLLNPKLAVNKGLILMFKQLYNTQGMSNGRDKTCFSNNWKCFPQPKYTSRTSVGGACLLTVHPARSTKTDIGGKKIRAKLSKLYVILKFGSQVYIFRISRPESSNCSIESVVRCLNTHCLQVGVGPILFKCDQGAPV